MSNEATIEAMNEAIARFMGMEGTDEFIQKNYQYQKSWDLLIPVCQKIKAIKYPDFVSLMTMMSATQEMNNGLVSLDLDRTHKGVYKFLIWFNQQKQTNEQ